MKLSITSGWTVLPIAKGTVDNTSSYNIEIAKVNAEDGIIIYPKQRFAFNGVMKLRALNTITNINPVEITVVDFMDADGSIDTDDPENVVTEDEAEDLAREILGM